MFIVGCFCGAILAVCVCLSVLPSVFPSVRLSVRLPQFWFAYYFLIFLRDRAFLIGLCIPHGKTFPMLPWILSTWPWPWPLTYIWKTWTLHINFLPYDIGISYLACVFFLQDLFGGTLNFEHVTLTVTFDLHLDKFYSPQNFLTIRHRTFIFGVCVSYIRTFLVVT